MITNSRLQKLTIRLEKAFASALLPKVHLLLPGDPEPNDPTGIMMHIIFVDAPSGSLAHSTTKEL